MDYYIMITLILFVLISFETFQVNSREVIFPEKVTSDGTFVSYNLRHEYLREHLRVKRSLTDTSDSIHYSLSVTPNEKIIITLKPNYKLLSPGFVIEQWSKSHASDIHNKTPILAFNKIKRNKIFCYFSGYVQNKTASFVSLSTCNGLRGMIRISNDDLIIEPINAQTNSSEPHPHFVYKRSIQYPDNSISNQIFHTHDSCGTTDDTESGFKRREYWEKRHKKRLKHRLKRSVSVERNVETLIVADQKAIDYYTNEDLELYILTVMNVVNTLYHDASIGNAINIVIVRVILMQNETNDTFAISSHANITLHNFCHWQKHINPKDENHPNHHDAAILITRENICRNAEVSCNTLGLAEIAGMCQPQRSCAITEDTGLTLAYTIAHELGHNFGMSHDGPQNGCSLPFGAKHHIMSPDINSEASPVVWSNCSRSEITKFLDRDWGQCLDDEPSDHDFTYPQLPPGTMYDADHQCRLQFGQNVTFCYEMPTLCETLWCKIGGQCITKLRPAAEGTICEKNKWCFLGRCVEIGDRPGAIDGEWGPWSAWSECTRSCGAGVMHSERLCNNPMPEFGGRYCIGDRRRYRVCNTMSCQSDSPSFRAIQCSAFDDVPFKNETYKWQPVLAPATPCQLHCKSEGKSFSIMLSDAVIDGTPCHPGTRDMCINGKCRSVSCDWGIDSEAQEDRCGICHGDGTQCFTVRGNFTQSTGFGYVEILTVPEGARNIRIEELYDDDNYLAIIDSHGDYILNGDWLIDWTGEYQVLETTFYYDREANGSDSLHAPGPTKEIIKVMGENRGIKWEYTIADYNTSRKPEFSWEYDEYDTCSALCGGGMQTAKVRCFEKEAGLVEDKFCSLQLKPEDITRPCNKHICPARWWTGPWQHCNATCGVNGVRRRSVLCVRSLGPDEQIALLENECDLNERPIQVEACNHTKQCVAPMLKSQLVNNTLNDSKINLMNCPNQFESKFFCKSVIHLCDSTYVKAKCCNICMKHMNEIKDSQR